MRMTGLPNNHTVGDRFISGEELNCADALKVTEQAKWALCDESGDVNTQGYQRIFGLYLVCFDYKSLIDTKYIDRERCLCYAYSIKYLIDTIYCEMR